ncbi:MAG TPA: hypothetical protein VFQ76_05925 [Longimicrobiaceae bacterium]|nr:hypothetical protein [Longimicrobiaceae bacterium]
MTDAKDLLTPEERELVEEIRRSYPSHLHAIIDRLAPAPKPPRPRLGELAAKWREMLADPCATEVNRVLIRSMSSELDAAMAEWRERLGSDRAFEALTDAAESGGPCSRENARKATAAILDALLNDKELAP